jgi:hypothetical protein
LDTKCSPTIRLATGSRWAKARSINAHRERARFEGEAGAWVLPRVSVSRLERYMKCPFQFYVANVLQVAEQPEDEVSRSPLERGRFLHELFETFFHEWQERKRGRISAENIDEARALFEEIAGPALRSLPPAEAGLERARLFGSAVGSGIVDRVFAMEAERGSGIANADGVRARWRIHIRRGETALRERQAAREDRSRRPAGRRHVPADRLQDEVRARSPQALQLPIYSACVRSSLARRTARHPGSEAMYLSFEGPQAVVPLEERRQAVRRADGLGGHRLVAALDNIAAGHYPSRPRPGIFARCARSWRCAGIPGGLDEGADD